MGWLLRRFADEANIAGDEEGGQCPHKELEHPGAPGHCLTPAARGVEVAAAANACGAQREATVDTDADLLSQRAWAVRVIGLGGVHGNVMVWTGGNVSGSDAQPGCRKKHD
jgi:hypothetical protein